MSLSRAEQARRRRFQSFMETYYAARQADLDRLEHETCLYPAEIRDWITQHGHPLYFKRYLIESKGLPR